MKLRIANLSAAVGLILLGTMLVFGQAPPTPSPAAPAKDEAQKADPSQLTKLEQKTLENLTLRMQILNQEESSLPDRKRDLQMEYSNAVQEIIAAHPGHYWNPQTGTLVAMPKAPEKPKAQEPKPAAPAAEKK